MGRTDSLFIAGLLLTSCVGLCADPPVVAKPAPAPDEKKPAKQEKKRPTTKEEFEALAKEGPNPPWLPFPGVKRVGDDHVYGTVVSVSDDAIEILPNGKKEAVKYPAYTLLVSGAVCHWLWDSECYLLDDVRKGDEVMLGVGAVDKEKGPECFYVTIQRRPGGVIPPSRKVSDVHPYHVERQRKLDAEDNGAYTPEELKAYQEKEKYCAEHGLPPPPPLPERKPRAKPTDEPKKDEPTKDEKK